MIFCFLNGIGKYGGLFGKSKMVELALSSAAIKTGEVDDQKFPFAILLTQAKR